MVHRFSTCTRFDKDRDMITKDWFFINCELCIKNRTEPHKKNCSELPKSKKNRTVKKTEVPKPDFEKLRNYFK